MREQNLTTRWFAFRRCAWLVIAVGIACANIAVANVCGVAQEAEGVLVETITHRDLVAARDRSANLQMMSGAQLLITEMGPSPTVALHFSIPNGAVLRCEMPPGDTREFSVPWVLGGSKYEMFVDGGLPLGIQANDAKALF